MGAVATSIDVCNLALAKIGANSIASLSESTLERRECSRFYPLARLETLRAGAWPFAVARGTLARMVAAPAFGYSYQYLMAADCVHVLDVNGHHGEFEVEGDRLLSNDASAEVRYVTDHDVPSQWPADFVEAVSTNLAAKLAMPLAGSAELKVGLEAEFEALDLPRAQRQGSNENDRAKLPDLALSSPLVMSRHRRFS